MVLEVRFAAQVPPRPLAFHSSLVEPALQGRTGRTASMSDPPQMNRSQPVTTGAHRVHFPLRRRPVRSCLKLTNQRDVVVRRPVAEPDAAAAAHCLVMLGADRPLDIPESQDFRDLLGQHLFEGCLDVVGRPRLLRPVVDGNLAIQQPRFLPLGVANCQNIPNESGFPLGLRRRTRPRSSAVGKCTKHKPLSGRESSGSGPSMLGWQGLQRSFGASEIVEVERLGQAI
jgi:hypothetical protein